MTVSDVCIPMYPGGLEVVENHNTAIKNGAECYGESCPLLLCPLTSRRFVELINYIAELEAELREIRAAS